MPDRGVICACRSARRMLTRMLTRMLMRMRVLSLVALSTACADGDSRGAAAVVIDSASGRREEADERAEWRATRAGDTVRIEERATFGEDGVAERAFVFVDDRLATADETRTQTVLSGDRSPEPLRSRITVDFGSGDGLVRTTRTGAGDSSRSAHDYEIGNLRRIADALLAQAKRAMNRAPIQQ